MFDLAPKALQHKASTSGGLTPLSPPHQSKTQKITDSAPSSYQVSQAPFRSMKTLNVATHGTGAVRSDFGKFTNQYNTGKSQLLETYHMNLEQRERVILLKKLMGGWSIEPAERRVLEEYLTSQNVPERNKKDPLHEFFDLRQNVFGLDREKEELTLDGKAVGEMTHADLQKSMITRLETGNEMPTPGKISPRNGGALTDLNRDHDGHSDQDDLLDFESMRDINGRVMTPAIHSLHNLSQEPRFGSPPYTSKYNLRN